MRIQARVAFINDARFNLPVSFDIVIPTYKNTTLLARCLDSLANCALPRSLHQILVVENGGEYGAREVVSTYQTSLPVSYYYQQEGNLSKARNFGANESSADIIVFFDNDMTFNSQTLLAYAQAFDRFGCNHFYGGPLDPDYQETPPDWLQPFLPHSAKGFNLGQEDKVYLRPDFLGGNHAVPRKLLLELGGYDASCATGENQGALGEETRLQQRLLAAGITGFYVANALAFHYVPKSNCSEEWLLQRARRHGITQMIDEFDAETSKFRLTLFLVKDFLYTFANWQISRIKSHNKQVQFAKQLKFNIRSGNLQQLLRFK